MKCGTGNTIAFIVSGLSLLPMLALPSFAGGPRYQRASRDAPVVRYVPTGSMPLPPLGSGFVSTPTIMVRGNGTAGGGYSPLGQFGDTTLVLYGPLSVFRTTSAPVATYTRGYDGRITVGTGTSFSNPNQPTLSPVIYPTQATNFYGFRQSGSPPWWQNASTWLDQN